MPVEYSNGRMTITVPEQFQPTARTVQTKAGHLGQVMVRGEIVSESGPFTEQADALQWAQDLIHERIKGLFA